MAFPGPFAAFQRLPSPVRGTVWAVLASALFAAMTGIVRLLAEELPPVQLVFFRNLFGFAFMLPWLAVSGLGALRTGHHRLYLARSLLALVSMFCWFTGVALLPLNEATALSFTAPLFTTICAVIFVGEIVRIRRWTATLVGFLGAMVILRPGFAELNWAQAMLIGSAAIVGFNSILIKQLTRTEPPNAIVTYMTLYILPFSLVAALFVWVTPPLHTWPWLVAMGLFATLGHQALTRAFVCLEASTVTAVDYVRLPFVALIAWFGFAEAPDGWTWFGAAIIVAATAYIAHRETIVARESKEEGLVPAAAAGAMDPPLAAVATVKATGAASRRAGDD